MAQLFGGLTHILNGGRFDRFGHCPGGGSTFSRLDNNNPALGDRLVGEVELRWRKQFTRLFDDGRDRRGQC
jgi:hypothetical protein